MISSKELSESSSSSSEFRITRSDDPVVNNDGGRGATSSFFGDSGLVKVLGGGDKLEVYPRSDGSGAVSVVEAAWPIVIGGLKI